MAKNSGAGSELVTLPIRRIEPRVPDSFGSCSRIRATTDRQTMAWVVRFSSSVRSQASRPTVWIGPSPNRRPLPPATEKRPSIRPNRSTQAATASSTASSSARSAARHAATPPAASIRSASSRARSSPRDDEDLPAFRGDAFGGGGGHPRRAGDEADAAGEAVHARTARAVAASVTSTPTTPVRRAPRIAATFAGPAATATTLGTRRRSSIGMAMARSARSGATNAPSAVNGWTSRSPTAPSRVSRLASAVESAPDRRRDELAAPSVAPKAPIPTSATAIASNHLAVVRDLGLAQEGGPQIGGFDERRRVDPMVPGAEPLREDAGQVARIAGRVEARRAAGELDHVDRGILAGRHRAHDPSHGRAPGDADRFAWLEQAVDDLGAEAGKTAVAGASAAATTQRPIPKRSATRAPSARSWAGASRNSMRTTPSANARSRRRATRKREIPRRAAISTLVSWRSKNSRATWPRSSAGSSVGLRGLVERGRHGIASIAATTARRSVAGHPSEGRSDADRDGAGRKERNRVGRVDAAGHDRLDLGQGTAQLADVARAERGAGEQLHERRPGAPRGVCLGRSGGAGDERQAGVERRAEDLMVEDGAHAEGGASVDRGIGVGYSSGSCRRRPRRRRRRDRGRPEVCRGVGRIERDLQDPDAVRDELVDEGEESLARLDPAQDGDQAACRGWRPRRGSDRRLTGSPDTAEHRHRTDGRQPLR